MTGMMIMTNSKMDTKNDGNRQDPQPRDRYGMTCKILYITAAILMPGIFVFYLFNVNKLENNLYFSHFVIMALFCSLISCGLFILLHRLVRSREGALLLLFLCWAWFFTFEGVNSFFMGHFPGYRRRLSVVVFVVLLAILAYVFRRSSEKLKRATAPFFTMSLVLLCLFIVNFGQALYSDVLIGFTRPSGTEGLYEVKTHFNIDKSSPSPDIYWIHMEEGMNFPTNEKYFSDAQEDLKAALRERGFVLNLDAQLHAGDTLRALPALLSPQFYDSYLGALLSQNEHLDRRTRMEHYDHAYKRNGISYIDDIATDFELFRAFMAKGYRQITFNYNPDNFLPLMDLYYAIYARRERDISFLSWNTVKNRRRRAELGEIHELLTMTTPLIFVANQIAELLDSQVYIQENPQFAFTGEAQQLARQAALRSGKVAEDSRAFGEATKLLVSLNDSFYLSSPKLLYIVNNIAHSGYNKIYGEGVESPSPDNGFNVDLLYWPQWQFAVWTTLEMIDLILEHDPDAVIILQGDHGIHDLRAHDYLRSAGYSDAGILEMNFSTLSALRIPETYAGLSMALDPLDITRVLVNRYVGQNYQMAGDIEE